MLSQSNPKINLALDILSYDTSGYHEILTVYHEVREPHDDLVIEATSDGLVRFICKNPSIPAGEENTIIKAAHLLKKMAHIKDFGAAITLVKRIPIMGGLGGGSGNAVAALKALAEMWQVKCCASAESHHDKMCLLRGIANEIGMDCTFFFNGGTVLGEHFGEKITPLSPLPKEIKIKIIETDVKISSKWAYENIDLKTCGKNKEATYKLIEALKKSDAEGIITHCHNDFESLIFAKYPQLLEKKLAIEKAEGGKVILCGSGGCLANIKIIHS